MLFRTAGILTLTVLSFTVALLDLHELGAEEPSGDNSSTAVNVAVPVRSVLKINFPDVRDADLGSQHPLLPTLHLAQDAYRRLTDEVHDYTCVMVKRERINGRLLGPETIFAKVRHEPGADPEAATPVSLYLNFRSPETLSGREILFPAASGDERLLVRNGGRRLAFMTLELSPTCPLAMTGNRYPITEFGIKRLLERMLYLGEKELAYDECEVVIEPEFDFEGLDCTLVEVCHPLRRPHFLYHIARVCIDNELNLPIHFEAYDWPASEGDEPVLIEDYTYRDLKLNVGLADADFQRNNPDYLFRNKN